MDERNIQYNVDVNNNNSNFASDEILIPHNKAFKLSQDIRNNKETNNIKLKNSFQAFATVNHIEDTFNEVSDTTLLQTENEKVTVNTMAGQSQEKKKRETTIILRDTLKYKEKRQGERSNKMLS